jgi:exonuclease SbcC
VRILKVSFANLNSLYGTWEIDFTHPAYIHDGIFAITGPTGAGKSTILDAICLALYGSTPRLDLVGGQSNEIMSRHTAHCFAEVTFETAQGRYRCAWRQRRARNRVEGNLVASEHEFIHATTGAIICSKKREVAAAVETYTGMNFERFTRSMLLAQGQFAAFLTCDADQRAPILEQITGTEVYSRISQSVHEKKREEELKLQQLQQQAQSLEPLSSEAVTHLKERHALMRRWEENITQRLESIRVALAHLKQRSTLQSMFDQLIQDRKQLERERVVIDTLRSRYDLAMKALELESPYHELCDLRKAQQEDQALLQQEGEQVQIYELQVSDAESAHQESNERLLEAQRRRDDAQPVLRRAREISQHLTTILTRSDSMRAQLVALIKQRRAHSKEDGALQNTLQRLQGDLSEQQQWITEHQVDAHLETVLAQLQLSLHLIQQAERDVSERETQYETAQTLAAKQQRAYNMARTACQEKEEAVRTCESELQESHTDFDQLLQGETKASLQREFRLVQEQQVLQARIASLTEHRQNLVDGEPCPLCGAVEHPYALNGAPTGEETAHRFQKLQALLDAIDLAEIRVRDLKETQGKLLSDQRIAQGHRDQVVQLLADAHQQEKTLQLALAEAKEQYQKKKKEIQQLLAPYGIGELPENLSVQLQERLQVFREAQKAVEEIQRQIGQTKQQCIAIRKMILSEQQQIQKIRDSLVKQNQAAVHDYDVLRELLGDFGADELQESLDVKLREVQSAVQECAHHLGSVKGELALHVQSEKVVKNRVAQRTELLQQREREFLQLLIDHSFTDEQAFKAARCMPDERSRMKERLETWEQNLQAFDIKIAETQRQLDAIGVEHLACWDQDSLHQAAERGEVHLRDIHQQMGAIQQQLDDYQNRRTLYSQQLQKVEQQKQIFHGWDRLNMLIGSHDGKKFRNYAQSLTFELLIAHANEHLKALSDRYLLVADKTKVLDISVIDLYQAGEVRSAKNLSGGESFLVSLALALALSTIASKRVQVDSLFLDEGFGTLDEQTLEIALTALSTLRNRGKLVGIISHVGALQERIPVQISVIPLSGGVSRIEGPGCVAKS